MKYLILFILIACGKNQTPPPLDIEDSDGDLISNHEEGPTNKYIASIMALDEVEGVLSFTPEGKKTIELPFTNKQDLRQLSYSLLTRGRKHQYDKNYFTEWSKLKLQKKVDVSYIKHSTKVTLNFASTKTNPTFIWLNHYKSKVKVAAWEKNVSFALKMKDLQALINGESFLSLSNHWMDRYSGKVEKNTYRVLHFKKSHGKVYYVSHELLFEDFLRHLNIDNHQPLDDQELFTLAGLVRTVQWWSRSVNKTDKVIVEAEASSVIDYYKMGFTQEKKKIFRVNGQVKAQMNLIKDPDARLLLRLKGEWFKRHFKDRIWYERHNEDSGRDRVLYDCRYFARDIAKETKHMMGLDLILRQLRIIGDKGSFNFSDASLLEESASSWTLSIPTSSKKIEIQMINNLKGAHAITGLYNAVCERGRAGPRHAIRKSNTPEEARMEISIEALVEKP